MEQVIKKVWVARDQDDALCEYPKKRKPKKEYYGEKMFWANDFNDFERIPKEFFPEITWQTEPVLMELVLREVKEDK